MGFIMTPNFEPQGLLMVEIRGVITSMLTPFSEQYSLDDETLAQELEYQIQAGVDGICILGGTGEALSLNPNERLRVVDITVDVVKGRVPIVVGCFIPIESEIIEFANAIKDRGASAMMLTPPAFYKHNARQFELLLERISLQANIPLVLFNSPSRVGVNLGAENVIRYVNRFPNIVAVKESSGSLKEVIQMGQAFPSRCNLLQGIDDAFLPSLASGATGGIMAFAGPMPTILVDILSGWQNSDNQTALQRQLSIIPVMKIVAREPMPILVKEAMNVVGRPMGPTRPPLYQPSPEDKKALWKEMETLLSG
jgi:4-hydroxy-tetrahydrodipicolinate synthase